MSKFARDSAVYPFTPSADHTEKQGYLVNLAGDVATISASATVPAEGVILDGEGVTGQDSIGILGAIPPARLKAHDAITKGDRVAQHTDGTVVTDPAAGARVIVGIAMEDAAADELFEVALFTPIAFAA